MSNGHIITGIDGIGICRAGRYTGDLAGDTFGCITYGNSAYSRFPGS